MNEENTKYLKNHFSFLRTKTDGDRTVSLGLFGFECEDGWFNIIKDLCEKLEQLKIPHYQVNQVKEKFGGLRFYAGGIPDEYRDKVTQLITEAENFSVQVCELCGNPGQLHSRWGWIKTVCNDCAELHNYTKHSEPFGY